MSSIQKHLITIPARRQWDDETRTFVTNWPAYTTTATVTIDVEGIAQHWGQKAATSKRGVSKAMNGHVKVQVKA